VVVDLLGGDAPDLLGELGGSGVELPGLDGGDAGGGPVHRDDGDFSDLVGRLEGGDAAQGGGVVDGEGGVEVLEAPQQVLHLRAGVLDGPRRIGGVQDGHARVLGHLFLEAGHPVDARLVDRVVEDDDLGVGLDLGQGPAGQPARLDVVAGHRAQDQVDVLGRGVHHDARDLLLLGLEQSSLDALPVDGIDEDGRRILVNHVGEVVLLFEAVPLGVQRDQAVAVRLHHLLDALVQLDEERVVHRLEGDGEQPALLSRRGLGGRGVASGATQVQPQEAQCDHEQEPGLHLVFS